jgi:histidinol dehydrogenase
VKTFDWPSMTARERETALARPEQRGDPALQAAVRAIVEDVRTRGWEAVVAHAERIDGAAPKLVPVAPLAEEARRTLSTEQLRAINLAHKNITAFHKGSLPAEHIVETMPGLSVSKIWRSIERIGLYIPGGRTPLFSTLLMLAIPARAAGVKEIVVVTPPCSPAKAGAQKGAGTGPRPSPGNSLDPIIALAADLCGIGAIWTLGGAQAIAALGFGAGQIPRVAKICGPGNAWVAEAKTYLASLPGGPAIDMPAGPSELLVIADDSADPALVTADLLSQAEHDASAQVILVTPCAAFADRLAARIEAEARALPRADIALASLANARLILTDNLEQAAEIANLYAPEHLSLAIDEPDGLVGLINNAGAIFAGHKAAETFGDYLAGSSHVLPTDGAARAWSGVSAFTFLKAISVQSVTDEAARRLAAPAAALARLEGLEAHARAAEARLAGAQA